MSKFDAMLKELQALNTIQTTGGWEENIPEDIWNEFFKETVRKDVAQGLEVDSRRHYETSISVVNIYDRLLGIRYITNIYSETSDWESCYVEMQYMEMKEVKVISYEQV